MSKITIYITNYNYSNYIDQAIKSVLKQKSVGFELLIIDDGSTDGSKNIIERYRGTPNVTIVYQQNKGLNVTNNIALRLSKGEYIMRLDADDYLEYDALKLLSQELDNDNDLGLIFPDYYVVDKEGKIKERHHRHDFEEEVTLFDQAAHGACTMIRTSFLKALGGYNENYKCQDGYELWVKFINNYKVKNLDKPLFYYRHHGNNLTSNEKRILSTRARINADYIKKKDANVNSIAIIPIRDLNDLYFNLKYKNKTLLNHKLEQAIQSKSINKVYLACKDKNILKFVDKTIMQSTKFNFFQRSEKSIQYNVSLATTVNEVLRSQDDAKIQSTVILDVKFPLINSMLVDDAVNTLHLFNSNSLISVRAFPNLIFRHDGSGMKAIMKQDKFNKIEREQLYQHVGGITVIKNNSFFQNQILLHGKVGHIILDKISSLGVEDEIDIKILNTLNH